MDINIFKLTFNDIEIAKRDIPKIRGFIANNFPEFDELHNHNGEGFIYRYPLIQYKTIERNPCILGINEGADILKSIENKIDELNISGNIIEIYEKSLSIKKLQYGISDALLEYSFESPWMCLNEENYNKYFTLSEEDKVNLLKRILIGNVLSMSKRFNYTVEDKLETFIDLTPCTINFKNQKMIAFKGKFMINFYIPDYMGIGKSVSRGFGTAKRISSQQYK